MSTLYTRYFSALTDYNAGNPIDDRDLDGEFDAITAALNRKVLCATSAPSSPIAGQTWIDTTNKKAKVYLDSEWKEFVLSDNLYPVGSIYINADDGTNPNTLLGFGTWEAFGAGKVMVGIDDGDEDFDTAEETGGAKTFDNSHTHEAGTIYHPTNAGLAGGAASGYGNSVSNIVSEGNTASAGSETESLLQPYIVVYFWKRTA